MLAVNGDETDAAEEKTDVGPDGVVSIGCCCPLTTEIDAADGKSDKYSISDGCTSSIWSSTCGGSGVPSSLGVDAVCGLATDPGAGVVAWLGDSGGSPLPPPPLAPTPMRGFLRCLSFRRERNLLVTTRV